MDKNGEELQDDPFLYVDCLNPKILKVEKIISSINRSVQHFH